MGYSVPPWVQYIIVAIIFVPLYIWQASFIKNVYKFVITNKEAQEKPKQDASAGAEKDKKKAGKVAGEKEKAE